MKNNIPKGKHEVGGKHHIIVDGMNLAYITRYAYARLINRGRSVAMYYGYMKMLQSILKRNNWKPEKLIIVWDGEKHPKRLEWLPEYKSHREEKRDATIESLFRKQVIKLRKFLYFMGICQIHNPHVEGDDAIYLTTQKYLKLSKITIISSDKDMLQMVNNDVRVYNPRNDALYVPRLVAAGNYGIGCDKIVDFFCLVGDKSDDIPGVRGIAEVRAAKFLNSYNSIDNYLKDNKAEFGGLIDKENLAKIYKRNKKLIDLKWFCEKYYSEDDIKYYNNNQSPEFNEEQYINFCGDYGMKTYLLPLFINWLKNFQN